MIAILLGKSTAAMASGLAADQVWMAESPDLDYTWEAYLDVLANVISAHSPRLFLFGETSIGTELAGGLSARLNLPLVSYCRELSVENGNLIATCQICAGRLMADGCLPEGTTLVSMLPGGVKKEEGMTATPPEMIPLPLPDLTGGRVTVNKFIELDASDVDITQMAVLVSVGRGIQRQDNLELAEELAAELGGAVCGTRPVVDQSWLPSSRLIGKSGKTVKPKLYLALGISGAPEHMEGIPEGTQIVAINTDAQAPIFNAAQYGATIDLLDLLPALTEKVREIKGA